jgi:hypothetical protein
MPTRNNLNVQHSFRLLASYFTFACSKESNQIKEHHYRLIPVLLSLMGVKLKLASLRQSLAENPHKACAVPVKGMSAKCPLFYSDLGAIGAAKGLKEQRCFIGLQQLFHVLFNICSYSFGG